MKPKLLRIFKSFLLVLFFASFTNIFSQDVSVSADLVSRYIWRGTALGSNFPCIQPTVELSLGGFTAGLWGSHTFKNSSDFEVDLYAGYSLEIPETGSLGIQLTDYTNPDNGTSLDNFNNFDNENGPGAHYVEMNVSYSGPEILPVYFSFNMYLYNVEKHPIYLELGYTASVMDMELKPFIGATPGDKAVSLLDDGSFEDNSYYGVNSFSIINIGLTATKSFKIMDSYDLPVFGSLIHNPAAKKTFFVVGASFQIL